jgi:hypothetical protein
MKAILFLLFLKDFSCSIKIKFKKKRGGGKEGNGGGVNSSIIYLI